MSVSLIWNHFIFLFLLSPPPLPLNLKELSEITVEERSRLPKLKVPDKTQAASNKILTESLEDVNTIEDITNQVYAMGRAIARSLGVEVNPKNPKGNRREREKTNKIKLLRRKIAQVSYEIYRHKIKRKATEKEKKILKDIAKWMGVNSVKEEEFLKHKEIWPDELRCGEDTVGKDARKVKEESRTTICLEMKKDYS